MVACSFVYTHNGVVTVTKNNTETGHHSEATIEFWVEIIIAVQVINICGLQTATLSSFLRHGKDMA